MLHEPIREVIPSVFHLRTPGSGVFLLLDHRITLIDTGYRGATPYILSALRRLGRDVRDIERIIVTHYHPDHVGSLAELCRLTGADAAAHALEVPYLTGERTPPVPLHLPLPVAATRPFAQRLRPAPAPLTRPLHDGDELPVLGGLRIVHTPGHTPGHIALHLLHHGLLIGGDALQVRGHGRLIPPHPLYTEDRAAARQSIVRLAGLDFDTLSLSHFAPQSGDVHTRLDRLLSRSNLP